MLVDVPYPAEFRPAPSGRSTLAEVAAQAGGSVLSTDETRTFSGSLRSLRTPLLVLALLLFLLSVAVRLLVRSIASHTHAARGARATGGSLGAPAHATVSDSSFACSSSRSSGSWSLRACR